MSIREYVPVIPLEEFPVSTFYRWYMRGIAHRPHIEEFGDVFEACFAEDRKTVFSAEDEGG
jgi:hypothetical protein